MGVEGLPGCKKKQDGMGRSTLYRVKTYRKVAVAKTMWWEKRINR